MNDSFGCSRGSLDLDNIKFEIGPSDSHPSNGFPVSKHEARNNFKILMF